MRQLLFALDGLHSTGIVHRDIKPQNVIFSEGNNKISIHLQFHDKIFVLIKKNYPRQDHEPSKLSILEQQLTYELASTTFPKSSFWIQGTWSYFHYQEVLNTAQIKENFLLGQTLYFKKLFVLMVSLERLLKLYVYLAGMLHQSNIS